LHEHAFARQFFLNYALRQKLHIFGKLVHWSRPGEEIAPMFAGDQLYSFCAKIPNLRAALLCPAAPQADAPCDFTQGSGKETTYGQHSYRIRGQALEGGIAQCRIQIGNDLLVEIERRDGLRAMKTTAKTATNSGNRHL
jgi:hypothetical protein